MTRKEYNRSLFTMIKFHFIVYYFFIHVVSSFHLQQNPTLRANGLSTFHKLDFIRQSGFKLSNKSQIRLKSINKRSTSFILFEGGKDDNVSDEKALPNTKDSNIKSRINKAVNKFKARPGTYLLIPLVAAVVGWFTNWLAVQMLFYPIQYRGLNLVRWPEQPLGILGWQGIVPCKSRVMGDAMVNMVTKELLCVEEVFKRLDPRKVADILAPEVPKLGISIMEDLFPSWIVGLPKAAYSGFSKSTKEIIQHWNHNFLRDFTVEMQNNIGSILNLNNCVVEQMLADRTLLGKVFRTCGRKELAFLTDSGLWFGFMLGLIQMVVALFIENPWSLSIGGAIVGLATNWLALKWIFEPVNPTKVGPFLLQGQFMKRQVEVSTEFGDFFTKSVLTSDKLWHSILNDPTTSPKFNELFQKHFTKFVDLLSGNLGIKPEPEVIAMVSTRALEKLPNHLHALHPYVDKTLALTETIREQMLLLSPEKFERVLHPIFEEDELTLILAGAFLGFLAGLVQQGLETGAITIPNLEQIKKYIKALPANTRMTIQKIRSLKVKDVSNSIVKGTRSSILSCVGHFQRRIRKKNRESSEEEENKTTVDVVEESTANNK